MAMASSNHDGLGGLNPDVLTRVRAPMMNKAAVCAARRVTRASRYKRASRYELSGHADGSGVSHDRMTVAGAIRVSMCGGGSPRWVALPAHSLRDHAMVVSGPLRLRAEIITIFFQF
jgi:hypothetical protein